MPCDKWGLILILGLCLLQREELFSEDLNDRIWAKFSVLGNQMCQCFCECFRSHIEMVGVRRLNRNEYSEIKMK